MEEVTGFFAWLVTTYTLLGFGAATWYLSRKAWNAYGGVEFATWLFLFGANFSLVVGSLYYTGLANVLYLVARKKLFGF
jgi:hypothetical protein